MGSGAGLGRVFTQHMEQGDRRCCNYKLFDCSSNRKDDVMAIFSIKFNFISGKGPYVDLYGRCTTGGGFTIHGNEDDYFYECIDAGNYPNLRRLSFKKEELYTVIGTA
ncbi:hypothetical protein BD770DRAFT_442780 [Pilaira anomala]|nr:hypothetical protein BD770DRAFT_442780 [Pilaira anomala]